jgi:hypothetical protein
MSLGTDDLKATARGLVAHAVKNATTISPNQLTGLDANGDLVPWANTATLRWAGLSKVGQESGGAVVGTGAAGPKMLVDESGPIITAAVTGVTAATDKGKEVYGTSATALTLTPTANVGAIGTIVQRISGTTCRVQLATPMEYRTGVGSVDAITGLTDSSGYDGTADNTIAAMAAITTLTDDTGLSGTHNDTLAATTVPAALTENTGAIGGTNDGDLPALVDPNGDAGASVIAAIRENSTRINTIQTLLTVMAQNASDTAQKIIEFATREKVEAQNISDLAQKVNAILTALKGA